MAVGSAPNLVQTPNLGVAQITTGTGTSTVTAYTGGTVGSKIVGLIATSNDSAAQILQVALSRSGTAYTLGSVSIPAGSGGSTLGATPAVNLLSPSYIPGLPIDASGQPYLILKSTLDLLTVQTLATVTAGKSINSFVLGADF